MAILRRVSFALEPTKEGVPDLSWQFMEEAARIAAELFAKVRTEPASRRKDPGTAC
ncbi:hypothetical protein GCM10017322_40960 [Paracoccus aerius]|nr:hypothetical protein GCM10017322_40960 [Paracoccus aerius]